MRAALEATAEAVLITDAAGTIEYVNPAFTQITGYTAAQAVGQNMRMLKSGHHDAAFYEVLWTTIRSGATWHGAVVNRRADGTTYTEETTITPITGPGGITHYVAVKRDLTQQHRLESMAERGGRLDLIGDLAVSVAHDLANILTPLVIGVAALQSGGTEAEVKDTVADMAESTTRATLMVRQLLDFVRGGRGVRGRINTTALLRSYSAQLTKSLPSTVVFEAMIPPGLPALLVDALQLYQVLLNLCINAADAMPTGGTLTLEAAANQSSGGAAVELRVTDSGTGIEPEVIDHIFEPFFTTKPPGRGTGIGLPTVKRIVEAHGGTIHVATEPGRGSTFTVAFPAEPDAQSLRVS